VIALSDLQITVMAVDEFTSAMETLARLMAEWSVANRTAMGALRSFVESDAWARLDRQPRPRNHGPHRRKHPGVRRRRP
jgi:hypothetical protein